ncbi:RNA polymerase sigma-70 factor [Chitinophaga sp. Cy-1792]|uniref:RNA polymerase sigma-70 factor n=1 Tax=Chitinophaga sp. Cy-1792 TaxID=2608339 RepID=UPI0014204A1C|nr:RNA polymerase sigma-70 factor [Chitinophaga sp. Cy-1792]NIG55782.1 RNA polymerase sigma-70 factor [Chitinophaga sp. Cy-1792]
MTKIEISDLIERIVVCDDQQAFKLVYQHYFIRLFRLSYSIVKLKELAEEIANDALVMLWTKRSRLPAIHNLDLYLYTSVKNDAIAKLSKEQAKYTTDISTAIGEDLKITADPEKLMISAEMMKQLADAIASLPPRCRLIFKLIKEDGLKYKEVATLLDLSVKTVEAQMAIAVRKILAATQLQTTTQKLPQL